MLLPATTTELAGNFIGYEKGRIYSGNSITYFSEIRQGNCTSTPACTLNEGYVSTGSPLQSVSGPYTNVSLGTNGRYTMTDVDGSSMFSYLLSTAPPSSIFFEASPSKSKLAVGYGTAKLCHCLHSTTTGPFLAGITSPGHVTGYDFMGVLPLTATTGALGTLSGVTDTETQGSVSLGGSFGPWIMQNADSNGVSQATDGSGNLLGVCAFGSNSFMYCLSNSAEPNGDTPSVMLMNWQ